MARAKNANFENAFIKLASFLVLIKIKDVRNILSSVVGNIFQDVGWKEGTDIFLAKNFEKEDCWKRDYFLRGGIFYLLKSNLQHLKGVA